MKNKFLSLFNKEKIVKGLKWFFFSYIWLAVLLFVIDIVSKHVALNAFGGWETFYTGAPNDAYGTFLPGFMSFTLQFNTGAAWGIFGGIDGVARRVILIGISLIMTVAFIVFYSVKFKKINNWYKAFLMCLASGAFGNLIDRAFYPDGQVIDFLKFDFIPNFPIFNFADSVLVVTIFGMIIYMIVEEIMAYVKKRKLAKEPALNEENEATKVEENKEVEAIENQQKEEVKKEDLIEKEQDKNE